MDLRERYDELMEKDKKQKREQDKKRKEHEEELFQLDIQRANDKAQADGDFMAKFLKERAEVEERIRLHDQKVTKSNAHREKEIQ